MKGIFTILNYYFSPGRRAAQWPLATAPAAVGDRNLHQAKADINPNTLNEAELMKEILRLRRELEESRKENLFLKKAAAFFAKEID